MHLFSSGLEEKKNGNILEQFDSEDFADNKVIVAYEFNFDEGGVKNIGKHSGKKREC